jgi:membrane-associated phospholipid phosphatase
VDAAQTAEFPEMGNYFVEHTEVLPIDVRGIFSQWVLDAQEIGERPTAAFPSSHVGIATVLMILAIQARNKILFFALLPLYLLLCVATVYLKAHYVIDSISGFAVGIGFFYLTQWIYPKAKVALRLKD